MPKPTISSACLNAIGYHEQCEEAKRALEYVARVIRMDNQRDSKHKELSTAFGALYAAIWERQLDAIMKAFMWGLVDEASAKKARALAMKKFLADDREIMSHLQQNLDHPPRWSGIEEEEWRTVIREAFAEAEKK